ncbi:MAG: tRNA pseudouridine(38-40) synthase TruA, partial [Magnetococcales bacterium]|nr:tRNA pseudouridine(38-40) synthase TruA [Magnetococcales bacterium]
DPTIFLTMWCKKPSALDRGRVWHYPAALDARAMRQAAGFLLGTHDFSAFRAAQCQARSPVRTLSRCEVHRQDREIRIILGANGFLHHMVRNIVGSMALVGQEKESASWFAKVLASRERSLAGATAPAHGLYLNRVLY